MKRIFLFIAIVWLFIPQTVAAQEAADSEEWTDEQWSHYVDSLISAVRTPVMTDSIDCSLIDTDEDTGPHQPLYMPSNTPLYRKNN